MKAGTRVQADMANLAEALFHCAMSISARLRYRISVIALVSNSASANVCRS
jgi:hypothetical protein